MRFVKTIWHWCNSFENQWNWNVKTVKTISLYSTSFIMITRILNGNVISEVIVLKQFSLNSIKELIFLLSFIFFLYRPILGYFDFALKKYIPWVLVRLKFYFISFYFFYRFYILFSLIPDTAYILLDYCGIMMFLFRLFIHFFQLWIIIV